jgi:hypothetical protein
VSDLRLKLFKIDGKCVKQAQHGGRHILFNRRCCANCNY